LSKVGKILGNQDAATGTSRDLRDVGVVYEASPHVGVLLLFEPGHGVFDWKTDDIDAVQNVFGEKSDGGLGGKTVVGGKASRDGVELETAVPGGDGGAEAMSRQHFENGAACGVGGNLQEARHKDVRVEKGLL
jgi:hypothetical protein